MVVELALLLFFIVLYCSSTNEALGIEIVANGKQVGVIQSCAYVALFHDDDNVAMSLFAIYPEDLDPSSYSQTGGH